MCKRVFRFLRLAFALSKNKSNEKIDYIAIDLTCVWAKKTRTLDVPMYTMHCTCKQYDRYQLSSDSDSRILYLAVVLVLVFD